MFNLIVSVISVALVAALSAASVFYGGKSFTEASAKGDAASIVTHAQQVAGAFSLYSLANGQNSPTSVAALASSSEYLLSAPLPPATIPGSSAYALSFWNVAHSAPGACAATVATDVSDALQQCNAVFLDMGSNNLTICNKINAFLSPSQTGPWTASAVTDFNNNATNTFSLLGRSYTCVMATGASGATALFNGGSTESNPYVFVYKIRN